jgi:hypothetical protein
MSTPMEQFLVATTPGNPGPNEIAHWRSERVVWTTNKSQGKTTDIARFVHKNLGANWYKMRPTQWMATTLTEPPNDSDYDDMPALEYPVPPNKL